MPGIDAWSAARSSRSTPKICASRSSIVTRPSTLPYSLTTIAMWTFFCLKVRNRRLIGVVRGTNSGSCSSSPSGRTCAEPGGGAHEVLRVDDAADVVERLLVDRHAREPARRDLLDEALHRQVVRQREDPVARRHHLADVLVGELEHAMDQPALARVDLALRRAGVDELAELLLGQIARRARARAASPSGRSSSSAIAPMTSRTGVTTNGERAQQRQHARARPRRAATFAASVFAVTSAISTTSGSVIASARPAARPRRSDRAQRATTRARSRRARRRTPRCRSARSRSAGAGARACATIAAVGAARRLRASCSRSTRRSENSATSVPEQKPETNTHSTASGIATARSIRRLPATSPSAPARSGTSRRTSSPARARCRPRSGRRAPRRTPSRA